MQAVIVMDGTPEEIAALALLLRDENVSDTQVLIGVTEKGQEWTKDVEAPIHLKKLRKRIGLRQEDVAKLVGVGRSTVAMWESGATTPNASKLPMLANILHCTIDELYEGDSPGGVGQSSA